MHPPGSKGCLLTPHPGRYLLVLVPGVLCVVQHGPAAHGRDVDPQAWVLGHPLALQLLLVPDVGLNQVTRGFLGPHTGKTMHTQAHLRTRVAQGAQHGPRETQDQDPFAVSTQH